MDAEALDSLIDKWINWMGKSESGETHYTGKEFLRILERMKEKEEDYKREAVKRQIRREIDIHNYAIVMILDPLIGKMKYGKRN